MSQSDESQDVCKKQDTKIHDEFQKGQQEPAPPVPMIPDDIDDGDDNYPLITSVFSLASSDETDNPDKKSSSTKESPKDGKSTQLTSPTKVGTTSSNETVKLSQSSSFRINPKPSSSAAQGNAPYFVGKGKLLLPKSDEGKVYSTHQPSGMTFSKMVSIQPITTSASASTTSDGTKTSTSVLTRSAQKKKDATSGNNTGSDVPANATSGSSSPMINLSTTLPFLNMKSASTQIAVPPLNTVTPPSNPSLNVTNPLVQMVQRIAPATTVVKNPVTTLSKAIPPVTTTVKPPQPKPRHVNIAPAPTNPTKFVVVTKALSTPTASNPAVTTNPAAGNVRRIVTSPNQTKPALPVSPGQLMYLIENKTADGKTYRFLIPTDNAKIVTNPATNAKTITVVTTKAQPAAVAVTPSATAVTSPPTPLIRIVPKPPLTTAVTTVSQAPIATTVSQTPTTTVSAVTSSIPATGSKSVPTNTILNTARPVMLNFGTPPTVGGNVTPPGSTSPDTNIMNLTSPISEEESINTPPISPAPTEESPTNDDSIDSGLSPHEARIQKLKDLLRKQEDAVNRLREKRKKEIEDVRASPATTTSKSDTNAASNKRDSPFAVPLPPKKLRYEQYRRNKIKDTEMQTSKDGFLPNTDDTHFVKLVGLEKVVDKLKAKKILELSENKVSE